MRITMFVVHAKSGNIWLNHEICSTKHEADNIVHKLCENGTAAYVQTVAGEWKPTTKIHHSGLCDVL